MARVRRLLVVSIFLAGLATWSQPFPAAVETLEPAAHTLGEPTHEVSFAEAFVPGVIHPYWDNGYLIFRARETESANHTNVVLYDAQGGRAREGRIWFLDSRRVVIENVAATKAGNIVAVGHGDKADGTVAGFIAETDLTGNVERVIRTNPFFPSFACAASDGTVWALGREPEKEDAHEDYFMLRNYSFTQGLIHEHLPRMKFYRAIDTPDGQQTALRCTGSSVVLYSAWAKECIRIDQRHPGKNSVDRWWVDAAAVGNQRLTGFAVTDSGLVYASLGGLTDSGQPAPRGLYELTVEDAAKKLMHWSPVSGAVASVAPGAKPQAGLFGDLYGADGDSLVFTRTYSFGSLFWAPVK
jgi:hypothetical protein